MTTLDAKTFKRIQNGNLTPEKSRVAFKIGLNILCAWELDSKQRFAVLGIKEPTDLKFYLETKESFSDELQFRLSIIIGLHADLKRLFLQKQQRQEWMTHPHASLNGKSPIDILSSGNHDDILNLRQRLKSFMY